MTALGWKREATIIPFPVDEKTEGEIGICAAGGFEFKLNQSPFSKLTYLEYVVEYDDCLVPVRLADLLVAQLPEPLDLDGQCIDTKIRRKSCKFDTQKDYIFVFLKLDFAVRTTV